METHGITEIIVRLVFEVSFILLLAKIAGELTERYLKQPGVLGELVAGIVLGPYALGSKIHLPHLGPLFRLHTQHGGIPVSPELYSLAQIAVILLLFIAGLHTDLKQFLRYARQATVIALGGVIFPFVLGDLVTVWFGFADGFMHPTALFMGAALTATSVGITARVLADINKLNTPEGVTILAGAVVDDVMGILVLAIVVAIAAGGAPSWGHIGWITLKAVGFWAVLMGVGILVADPLMRFLKRVFQNQGSVLAVVMAIAFFFSALAEVFGLAMIIGAYAVGLALSKTEDASWLMEQLEPVYQIFVPIFFVVMGMMVDLGSMAHAIGFGVALTVVAVLTKVLGCGIPAVGMGFNVLGASRIGIGMLPRGEVALIVAGVAIAKGTIQKDMYGVAVMMTMVTTLLAPIFLVPLFRNEKSGLKKP